MAYSGTLTGNLGRDPEIKYFESGKTVASFSLAVRQWKKDAPARWIKVSVWGTTAQYVADNIRRGDKVALIGRVDASEIYTDKMGSNRVQEKFTALEVEKFTESKSVKSTSVESENCPMPQKLQATHEALQQVSPGTPSSVESTDEIPF